MGITLRNDRSSSLTQDSLPGEKTNELTQPSPYHEGPVWRQRASRLLEGLHLLHEQKAASQPSTPEAPQVQPKIETPVNAGTGGELKG